MRNADYVTIFRTAIIFLVVYLILIKWNAIGIILITLLAFVLDYFDGLLARHDMKKGMKATHYGAALDIAGDRITEYAFWITFTYLNVIPFFVIFIILVRNSLSDALTLSKGKTFSNMRSGFGKIAYSHFSRGLYGTIKMLTFLYLIMVYLAGYNITVGYALVTILVVYGVLRGSAEIYESI